MKKIISTVMFILLVFIAMPDDAYTAETYYTRDGYIATTNEDLLDMVINFVAANDQQAFMKLLYINPGVFMLKGGLEVYVEKITWDGKIKIRPVGQIVSIWTIRAAIYD